MEKISSQISFGVICGGTELYAWQKATLEKLALEADIELKLVVFVGSQQGKKHTKDSSSILWNLYKGIRKNPSALQLKEYDSLFEGITKIHCKFVKNDNGIVHLEDGHIDKIEHASLDFIINFSPLSIGGKVLNIPKHGVWAFQFGNLEKYRNGTPCFWEIYHNDVVTSAYLVRLTDELNTVNLLYEGHLKTSISHRKNSDKMFRECMAWPLKMCVDIRNGTSQNIGTDKKINAKKIRSAPSNLQTLFFLLIQFKQVVRKAWKQLFFTDYWNIGIVYTPIQDFLNVDKKHEVHWFPNLPRIRFMADPFGISFKDQLHIIYEDLKFDEGIGKTASFLFEDGAFTKNEIVIEEDFHMSYPFLLEHEGEVYCVPETYQANEVRLYKASEFPAKWTLEKVLIENYAGVDSTLFKHEGTWFLFSADKISGPHFNLNIHFAQDIFGTWEAHPKNPVKTDIRSARPAGTLFRHNEELFRPSMDYSEKIEGRITINKITTLTKYGFKEEAYHMIYPFKDTFYSDKVHTLSKIGPYTLVDGAKELFIFSNFNAFKYKMKRVLNKVRNK